ncbi:hypothetical protein GCM10027614_10500 [Micromonospora vulcania]
MHEPRDPDPGTQWYEPVASAPGVAAEGDGSVGYRGVTACTAVGISYRQLDYWARTALVVPSVRDASGSGTQRLYSFRDLVVLKVVKRLLDAGCPCRTSVRRSRRCGRVVWRIWPGSR